MLVIQAADVDYVRNKLKANGLKIGVGVAKELLRIGRNPDAVVEACLRNSGLDQTKAWLINDRFDKLEERIQ